jgi:hypothetical protein
MGAIVTLMPIPNRSLLGVSFRIPQVSSVRRSAELIYYPAGYYVARFSGEREIVSTDVRESIKDLLKLVPAPRAKTDEEVTWLASIEDVAITSLSEEDNRRSLKLHSVDRGLIRTDIAPESIVRFLNRWGLIGMLNPVADVLQISKPFYLSYFLNTPIPYRLDESKIKVKDLKAISHRDEIPISWIADVLYRLARMTRLTQALFSSNAVKNSSVDLDMKTMKRILSAWSALPFTFLENEDPGDSKFKMKKMWKTTPQDRLKLLDEELCQKILSEFTAEINFFIQPISSQVMLTCSFEELVQISGSYESAMAAHLLSFWSEQSRTLFRCEECQTLYRPKRVTGKNRFCGESCHRTHHKRKHRVKKKVEKEDQKKSGQSYLPPPLNPKLKDSTKKANE